MFPVTQIYRKNPIRININCNTFSYLCYHISPQFLQYDSQWVPFKICQIMTLLCSNFPSALITHRVKSKVITWFSLMTFSVLTYFSYSFIVSQAWLDHLHIRHTLTAGTFDWLCSAWNVHPLSMRITQFRTIFKSFFRYPLSEATGTILFESTYPSCTSGRLCLVLPLFCLV